MVQITFLIQLLLACSSMLHVSLALEVGAPVKTISGIATGRPARNRSDVSEYLGIRYAHPATGKRRFQPPVAFRSDKAVDAFEYSPACPFTPSPLLAYPNKSATFDSIYGKFLGRGKKTFSEDCLSLNIWSKGPNPAKLKPVLFFIHGGRFSTGTANITHYEGQYIADAGEVVMVSIKFVPLHGSQISCTDNPQLPLARSWIFWGSWTDTKHWHP
jgi:acetyl esterase/lipase